MTYLNGNGNASASPRIISGRSLAHRKLDARRRAAIQAQILLDEVNYKQTSRQLSQQIGASPGTWPRPRRLRPSSARRLPTAWTRPLRCCRRASRGRCRSLSTLSSSPQPSARSASIALLKSRRRSRLPPNRNSALPVAESDRQRRPSSKRLQSLWLSEFLALSASRTKFMRRRRGCRKSPPAICAAAARTFGIPPTAHTRNWRARCAPKGFYTVATHDDFLQRRALFDHLEAIVSNPPSLHG